MHSEQIVFDVFYKACHVSLLFLFPAIKHHFSTIRLLGYENVHLPLCEVAATLFHIQRDALPQYAPSHVLAYII